MFVARGTIKYRYLMFSPTVNNKWFHDIIRFLGCYVNITSIGSKHTSAHKEKLAFSVTLSNMEEWQLFSLCVSIDSVFCRSDCSLKRSINYYFSELIRFNFTKTSTRQARTKMAVACVKCRLFHVVSLLFK